VPPTPTREQRLRTIRERERATALERLGRAEDEVREIEAELGALDQRLADLAGRAEPLLPGTVATAAALASETRHRERDRRRGERLEADRRAVAARLRDARAAVELAQDEVASATRALRALGL
jgi:hypothetical protein